MSRLRAGTWRYESKVVIVVAGFSRGAGAVWTVFGFKFISSTDYVVLFMYKSWKHSHPGCASH